MNIANTTSDVTDDDKTFGRRLVKLKKIGKRMTFSIARLLLESAWGQNRDPFLLRFQGESYGLKRQHSALEL